MRVNILSQKLGLLNLVGDSIRLKRILFYKPKLKYTTTAGIINTPIRLDLFTPV